MKVDAKPAVSQWGANLMRDFGGERWRRPRFEAWRPNSGGVIVRVGWRWTAWAVTFYRNDLSREQADAIIKNNQRGQE